MSEHFAIKHPVKLYVEPMSILDVRGHNDWMLVAQDHQGNRVTIIASGERFNEALFHPRDGKDVERMYVRGEISVEIFEAELDKELGL